MFWTNALVQHTLFGEDEYRVSSTIRQLIRFAEETFPDCDSNFHRTVAFLTHDETQAFLRPMLVEHFGSLDAAKVPTVRWLDRLGSLETFARGTRKGIGGTNGGSGLAGARRGTPDWYAKYCTSSRFKCMKSQAEQHWRAYTNGLHCSVNARHPAEVFHHSDYGRFGEGDEFRYLVPLCHECHASVSARGPRIPALVPEAVKQWL